MADVVLERIVKRYPGGVEAVKDIDLDIGDGEFVVLVGPSGCGKSTTLRMIAGLEEISEGTLSIGGRVVNDVPPRDRDIAMVFQSYALYPHMTVFENMAFGLQLRKVPKAEIQQRVDDAAKMLGLTELLDRKPKAMSGGQRQRVAMGRAIVRKPSVFLFDEPLSNLDARLRVQMRVEIAGLHRRLGSTMVYVTHDQVEAMTLADRIAVMSMGLLQQFGSPMEVYHRPRNRFVAGFMGSPSMNFIDGEVVDEGGRRLFVGHGLRVPLGEELVAVLADAGVGDRGLTLGVRPQHMDAAEGDAVIGTGTVTHVELMGAETFAHTTMDDGTVLVVRLPGDHPVEVGSALSFGARDDHLHLFDETERNLAQGGEA